VYANPKIVKMAVSVGNLAKICSQNLVELKFSRRDKLRRPPTRRMLCTLDVKLLNSVFGKEILNFKPPKFSAPYNAVSRGLLTVWDLIMQDWRNVSCETCDVVTAVPTIPMESFLLYFDKHIKTMTTAQKAAFMDK